MIAGANSNNINGHICEKGEQIIPNLNSSFFQKKNLNKMLSS